MSQTYKFILAFSCLIALHWLAACAPVPTTTSAETPTSEVSSPTLAEAGLTPTLKTIDLPQPRLKGDLSLEEALARRRSVRQYSEAALSLEVLGQLLWAAQGITHPGGYRTAPSAGALYPLEVYAVTPKAAYHYEPQHHRLSIQAEGDLRPRLHQAALRQEAVLKAPAVIVITAVYARTTQKYGEQRGIRYVHLEAGHAAQNLLLQAVALGLGGVPIGAFHDAQVQQVLVLPADQQPLYLIPVGYPEGPSP